MITAEDTQLDLSLNLCSQYCFRVLFFAPGGVTLPQEYFWLDNYSELSLNSFNL